MVVEVKRGARRGTLRRVSMTCPTGIPDGTGAGNLIPLQKRNKTNNNNNKQTVPGNVRGSKGGLIVVGRE